MAGQDSIPEWLWELVTNEPDTATSPLVEPPLAADAEADAGPSSTRDESLDVEDIMRELYDLLPNITQADLDANDEFEKDMLGYENKLKENTAGKYFTFIKLSFKC